MNRSLVKVNLFADGCCLRNPGPGGWAFVMRGMLLRPQWIHSGGHPDTTNNRMEIRAVLEGLRRLRGRHRVIVTSDSQYVVQAINGWIHRWAKNGFVRSKGRKPIVNQDLWRKLLVLMSKHQVHAVWVKGHNGHPENELCDQLAARAARRALLCGEEIS